MLQEAAQVVDVEWHAVVEQLQFMLSDALIVCACMKGSACVPAALGKTGSAGSAPAPVATDATRRSPSAHADLDGRASVHRSPRFRACLAVQERMQIFVRHSQAQRRLHARLLRYLEGVDAAHDTGSEGGSPEEEETEGHLLIGIG